MKQNKALWSLFLFFLRIGSYSFGGYMALVAVVEKELIDRKKWLTSGQLMEGITLASFLPGPVAVNTVVFIGHQLKGVKGAIVSMIGVLLPTFLLVTIFSYAYFELGYASDIDPYVSFIMPVIVAIILEVCIRMYRKQVSSFAQSIIMITAVALSLLAKSVWTIPFILIAAGITGLFFFKNPGESSQEVKIIKSFFSDLKAVLVVAFVVFLSVSIIAILGEKTVIFQLLSVFSGMSVTLFGGGYVIIPIIEQWIVEDLQWLSLNEFSAAISISQTTPGPILISAAFIGYKLAGISGAMSGTIGIFLPSGLLMILLSSLHENIRNSPSFKAVMKGIKAAIIGLIASAAISIGMEQLSDGTAWIIFTASLFIFLLTKTQPVLVIVFALLIGLVII